MLEGEREWLLQAFPEGLQDGGRLQEWRRTVPPDVADTIFGDPLMRSHLEALLRERRPGRPLLLAAAAMNPQVALVELLNTKEPHAAIDLDLRRIRMLNQQVYIRTAPSDLESRPDPITLAPGHSFVSVWADGIPGCFVFRYLSLELYDASLRTAMAEELPSGRMRSQDLDLARDRMLTRAALKSVAIPDRVRSDPAGSECVEAWVGGSWVTIPAGSFLDILEDVSRVRAAFGVSDGLASRRGCGERRQARRPAEISENSSNGVR